MLAALAFSLFDFDLFHASVKTANDWVLSRFDWLFSLASFAAVLLVAWVFLSPLGAVRIGGPDAKPAFVFLTFAFFVTAMDSNTHSITGVCLKQNAPGGQHGKTALALKVFWGGLIGAVAWVMTSTTGIEGARQLSNLGGLPGLFILIAMGGVIVRMRLRWLDEIKAASQPANIPAPP